jgi:hypothetical protein
VTLTVALAVDVTVPLLLHAEPLVDVPPVVVPAHRIKTTFFKSAEFHKICIEITGVADPDPDRIHMLWASWIRIRIH